MRFQIILFLILLLLSSPPFFYSSAENTNSDEQIEFAEGLLQRGFYEMAKEEYLSFLENYPESKYLNQALFGLAETLFHLQLYRQAIVYYQKTIDKFPDNQQNSLVLLRIVEAYFNLNQLDKALKTLANFGPKVQGETKQGVLYYKAKILQKKEKIDKALDLFLESSQLNAIGRFKTLSFLETGKIYSSKKDYQKALNYYQRAYQSTDSAKLKGLILFEKGETEFFNQKYGKSIATFKTILTKFEKGDLYQNSLFYLLAALYESSQYKKVVTVFNQNKESIKKNPYFFEIYFWVASAYQKLSDYSQAEEAINELLKENKLKTDQFKQAIIKKAEIYLEAEDYHRAIGLINKNFGKENINIPQPLFIKAEAYYGLGKFRIAYDYYQNIIDNFPNSKFKDDSIYSMAYCWHILGKNKQALKLFLQYFKQGKDPEKRQDALYNAIIIEKNNNLLEEATRHSQIYLSKFDSGEFRETIFFQLGVFYSDLSKNEKAVKIFKDFISTYPKSYYIQQAYFLIAYNFQELKKYQKALEYYGQVTKKADKQIHYSTLKNSAFIYLKQDGQKQAAQTFQNIIDIYADNDLDADTYLWLGQYYLDCQEFKKTLSLLEGKVEEKKFNGYQAEIKFLKAEALRNLGKCQQAIKNYDSTLEYSKDSTSLQGASYIGKGLCLKQLGEYEQAEKEFETAVVENPNNHTLTMRARYELAGIKQDKGDLSQAAKFYMLVSVLYDNKKYVPLALEKAAGIFQKQNEKEKAKKAYRQILERYPDSSLADKIKNKLEESNAK